MKPALTVTSKPAEAGKGSATALSKHFKNGGYDFIQLVCGFAVRNAGLPGNFECNIRFLHPDPMLAVRLGESVAQQFGIARVRVAVAGVI